MMIYEYVYFVHVCRRRNVIRYLFASLLCAFRFPATANFVRKYFYVIYKLQSRCLGIAHVPIQDPTWTAPTVAFRICLDHFIIFLLSIWSVWYVFFSSFTHSQSLPTNNQFRIYFFRCDANPLTLVTYVSCIELFFPICRCRFSSIGVSNIKLISRDTHPFACAHTQSTTI